MPRPLNTPLICWCGGNPYGPGFSLKVAREVENHSEGVNFPLMWST